MEIYKPPYFDGFRCLAGACPDSCCHEWDVEVDGETAARYRAMPGPLGDRLRQVLADDPEGGTFMEAENGRCPMWRADGLCRIQVELGETALCGVCREFPRLTHDYGDFQERGLELSCPEAARLILAAPLSPMTVETAPGGRTPEYDGEAMSILRRSRASALALTVGRSPEEALAALLFYGADVQNWLDGGDPAVPGRGDPMALARELGVPGDMGDIFGFFRELDILTDRWRRRLSEAPAPEPMGQEILPLLRYFIQRYWLQAVSDYDLMGRVKLMIIACLVIAGLGGDAAAAQLFSKEIENSAENVDALLDAAYTHPAFADVRLLGLLCHRDGSLSS